MEHSSSSGSTQWSSKDIMNLSVRGSAVSCSVRPPRVRRRPPQPPNSPVLSVFKRSDLSRSLEEGCNLSRAPSLASSHPDLALDLSSVTDSSHNSDRSTTASSCDESEWSGTNRRIPPSYEKFSRRLSSNRPSACSRCTRRTSHSDLIDVYVETVKNTELTKFFRPCVTCGQICCQCPPSPLSFNFCGICPSQKGERAALSPCSRLGEEKICQCTSDEDRNSVVSRYLLERRFSPAEMQSPQGPLSEQAGDSGNSTLQLNESNREAVQSGILSRKHVSLSVMQLATAAQCARILADSLESVLELAKEELVEPRLVEGAFNHKSLLSAASKLGNADLQSNNGH